MRPRGLLALALLLLTALVTAGAPRQAIGPIELERAFLDISYEDPVFLTSAGDGSGRLFVVEPRGIIHVLASTEPRTAHAVFLDISGRVSRARREEGLLGLAFDPGFASNGYLYVYYSAAGPRRSVLSRFSVSPDPDAADAATELVLLEVAQPFSNHNGGMIAFGPDGFLYVALGDGGSSDDPQGNGQNLGTLLGSILRIDVHGATAEAPYRVPPDNPFVGVAGARDEIWAYGLRNPWRFSFDPATGDLWAADVGQADREEVDLILPGRNYGWNTLEGTRCLLTSDCDRSGLEPPVVEYAHGLGCSVTGGYVYRGADVPALSGVYVYADFCTGRIWGFRWTDGGVSEPVQLLRAPFQISSFGTDSRGELYVLGFDGSVYRFVGDPAEQPAAPTPTQAQPPPIPTQAPPPTSDAAPIPTTASPPLLAPTATALSPPAEPSATTAEPRAPAAPAAPETPLEGGRASGAIVAILIASGGGVLSLLYLWRRRLAR